MCIAEAWEEHAASHYVKPMSPKRAYQAFGKTMEGLAKLVRARRELLIDRES